MSILPADDPEFRDAAKRISVSGCGGRLARALAVAVVVGSLIALILPAIRPSTRDAARRYHCVNNLKQIMRALHSYNEAHSMLPPAYTAGPEGRPLHSWRTLILPYLGEHALYRSIDLSRPWNDPANAEALKTQVLNYVCGSNRDPASANLTVYRASVGSNAFLRTTTPRPHSTITDLLPATLAVVEVGSDDAIPWMSPEDAGEAMILNLGPDSKLPHPGGVYAGFADSAVRFLKANLKSEVRRALISVDGGETVSSDQY